MSAAGTASDTTRPGRAAGGPRPTPGAGGGGATGRGCWYLGKGRAVGCEGRGGGPSRRGSGIAGVSVSLEGLAWGKWGCWGQA